MKQIFIASVSFFIIFSCCTPKNAAILQQQKNPSRQLVWSDDFDYPNAQLDAKWISQNGPNTHILCSRWRENAVVENGFLHLNNKKENRGGQEWTSGSIWTKEQFLYGYFECRYKYAAATGTNNSFWMMTTGIMPTAGKKFEIDINEGHYPAEMATNIHNWTDVTTDPVTGKSTHPSFSKAFNLSSTNQVNLGKEFHTYGLEWTKDSLIYSFDGKVMRRAKNDFCHSPVPVYLSEAILTWAGPVTDAIDGTSMVVDWVKVHQKK
ncbi:MAG: glycoside hydrolase family 16 protein [Mariniphaga sp.]|nr:glycoside hydrolase family 16 protein [Mariniphaga sp.]